MLTSIRAGPAKDLILTPKPAYFTTHPPPPSNRRLLMPAKNVHFDEDKRHQPQESVPEVEEIAVEAPVGGAGEQHGVEGAQEENRVKFTAWP